MVLSRPRPILLRCALAPGAFRQLEQFPDQDRETGQDVAAIELHRGGQPSESVGRRVDVDDPGLRAYIPDQANAFLKELVELLFHLLAGVARADHLHGQIGDQEGDRFLGELIAREPLP